MDLVAIDDSKQRNPSRKGMGQLVAVGGLHVPSASIRPLSLALDDICKDFRFPSDQDEFKWSPHRGTWMRKNLEAEDRHAFFSECLKEAKVHDCQACIVIEDETHKTTDGKRDGHELDAVKLFLERTHNHLNAKDTEAILLADHPSGGRRAEARFVASCLETMREGTRFVDLEKIALVLTEDSKSVRLLQLADLIVGCTVAYVGGESDFSPALFDQHIKPMLRSEKGQIGGVGLKLHADLRYANLYHWLLGDSHFWKGAPAPVHRTLG
jgi:Protein of unknown function (DUF3800)